MQDSPDSLDCKIYQLISQLEIDVDFEYCLENFSNLCRFCCRLKNDELQFREIFDDSSDELLSESNDLIAKIQYTLYDNVSFNSIVKQIVEFCLFFLNLDSQKSRF